MASLNVFSYTHPTGYMFTTSERVALSTSLPLLASQTKRRQVTVWGKVFGLKADYIIVEAFDDDLTSEPELYYTIDAGLTFTLLGAVSALLGSLPHVPEGLAERQELKQNILNKIRGIFMGDPAYEYRITNDDTGAVTSYKESVRLALFIEEHDYECRVVPRGACIKHVPHHSQPGVVKYNSAFTGLPRSRRDAFDFQNYYHLRASDPYRRLLSRTEDNSTIHREVEKLSQNEALDAGFDSIARDTPPGVWQLCFDPMHDLVVGRNRRFVGAIFYHIPETTVFGNVYMGDGTINHNLTFEL